MSRRKDILLRTVKIFYDFVDFDLRLLYIYDKY